jgi:hypothetical protein
MRPAIAVETDTVDVAAESPACPCPNEETASAKSKPFLRGPVSMTHPAHAMQSQTDDVAKADLTSVRLRKSLVVFF